MTITERKKLARQAQAYYPNKHMRRQWFKQMCYLRESGRYLAINGKFPEKLH